MKNFSKMATKFSFALATSLMLISCGGSNSGSQSSDQQVVKPILNSKIVYVCADGKSGADGLSWDTCTDKIQDAITKAQINKQDLWFKAGEYILNETIILNKDTKLYGGFNGTEKELSDRKFENATILSGDKKIRVLKTENLSDKSVLDGFTITHGKTIGNSESDFGAGMQNINSKIIINNVSFIENEADLYGGGISNINSKPTLTNVSFIGNVATTSAMYNKRSDSIITNASFSKNISKGAGTIYNDFSNPTLTNATFSQNTAKGFSTIIDSAYSHPVFINVTITKNTVTDHENVISNSHSSPIIKNSILWNDATKFENQGSSTPVVSNSIIKGDNNNNGTQEPNLSEAKTKIVNGVTHIYYDLETGSFAIDKGENTDNTENTDMIGNKRIQGAKIDMGAVEKQDLLL